MKRDLDVLIALLEDIEEKVSITTHHWSPRVEGVKFDDAIGHLLLAICRTWVVAESLL